MNILRIGIWPTLGKPRWLCFPASFPVTIGRSHTSALRLKDQAVSALHADVRLDQNRLHFRDLGSRNGTLLEGQPVETAELQAGQTVRMGGFTLRFYAVELGQAPPSELEDMFKRLDRQAGPKLFGGLVNQWAKISPNEPRAQRALARELLQQGDLAGAEKAAERASWLAPSDMDTLLVLALLKEQQGLLDSAANLLHQASGKDPVDKEVARALARIRRKQEVYAKIHDLLGGDEGAQPCAPDREAILEAGPFRFRFTKGRHASLVLRAYAALAQIAQSLRDLLGFDPESVHVRIIDAGPPGREGSAAAYDGAIELYADKIASLDPNFLYVALSHEYVHLAVDRLTTGCCPAWLNEGLAQIVTQNLTSRDTAVLAEALSQDALIPLTILEQDFVRLEHSKLVDLAYTQSYSLMEYLLAELGWENMRKLLKDLGETRNLSKSMQKVSLTLAGLEERWRSWLA